MRVRRGRYLMREENSHLDVQVMSLEVCKGGSG